MRIINKSNKATSGTSYFQIFLFIGGIFILPAIFNGCSDTVNTVPNTKETIFAEKVSIPESSDADFKVFDGTSFRPKPEELTQSGLDYFELAKPNDMWGKSTGQLKGTTVLPDKGRIYEIAHNAAAGPNELALSIQHWPFTGDAATVEKTVNRYLEVLGWFKQAEPNLKLGLYRTLPVHKIWRSTKPQDSNTYKGWINMHDRLRPLAKEVNIFYPSLVTYVDDQELWVKDAKEQIQLARELNEDNPVYVVLWPKYHPYYDGYKDRFIEPDFWQLQLETAKKYADGIIIATRNSTKWDKLSPWWQKTKQFLKDIGKTPENDSITEFDGPVVSDANFKVFDGTYFLPKPWALDNYGLTDIAIAYTPTLWGKTQSQLEGTTSMPDKTKLKRFVEDAKRKGIKNISVDIEHWPLDGTPAEVETTMNRFIKVVDWIKETAPAMKVGFYGVPPMRNLHNSTQHTSSGNYQIWREQNKDLEELANHVDTFYPSLYTFNDNREQWVKEAKRQIEMAREFNGNKPVYVFLWPQYHPYEKKFSGKFIPYDFWKLQLKTARKYADGIVIYTPRYLKWNNSALWWKGVKRLMVSMDKVDWWDEWYKKKYN